MPEAAPCEIVRATIVILSGPGLAANTKNAAPKASKVEISMEPPKVIVAYGLSGYAVFAHAEGDGGKIRIFATKWRGVQSFGWRQQSITEAQERLFHTEPENGRDGKACDQVSDKANATLQVLFSDYQAHDVKDGLVREVEAIGQRGYESCTRHRPAA